MPTLYIANKNYSSWSLRVWVLMRELGIDFDERLVPFVPADQTSPFRAFSPTSRVPCLVEAHSPLGSLDPLHPLGPSDSPSLAGAPKNESGRGLTTIWDSLAITEYLAEHHPAVWPAQAGARHWARCASAEMHSGFQTLRQVCTMNCGVRVQLATITDGLRSDLERIDTLWCEGLDRFGGPFLAGPAFTAVDAFFCPVAFRIQSYGLQLSPPAVSYAQGLLALPSMRSWYEAALTEPWREEGHELDMRRSGVVQQDLRRSPL